MRLIQFAFFPNSSSQKNQRTEQPNLRSTDNSSVPQKAAKAKTQELNSQGDENDLRAQRLCQKRALTAYNYYKNQSERQDRVYFKVMVKCKRGGRKRNPSLLPPSPLPLQTNSISPKPSSNSAFPIFINLAYLSQVGFCNSRHRGCRAKGKGRLCRAGKGPRASHLGSLATHSSCVPRKGHRHLCQGLEMGLFSGLQPPLPLGSFC